MGEKKRFRVNADDLVDKFTQLIHEGNIRNIRIIHKGRILMDIPLLVGATAAAITLWAAPILVALGALAAVISECEIEIEKVDR